MLVGQVVSSKCLRSLGEPCVFWDQKKADTATRLIHPAAAYKPITLATGEQEAAQTSSHKLASDGEFNLLHNEQCAQSN